MNYDIYELLAHLAELKEPGVFDLEDEESLEEFIWNNYEINLENFNNLINDLLPLCDKAKSPLTDKLYQGFGTGNYWLVKKEAE